jgi:hypothetical protein
MLNSTEREEVRAIQNKVITSLQRPPKNYALLNVEEVSTWYLKEFKSIDQPFGEHEDIWLRYANKEDVQRWAKYLIPKLPDCFRQIETWDNRAPS